MPVSATEFHLSSYCFGRQINLFIFVSFWSVRRCSVACRSWMSIFHLDESCSWL